MIPQAIKLLAVICILSGCTTDLDKPSLTEFYPHDDGFRYKASTALGYEPDNPKAEEYRIRWLNEYVTDNHVCPSGFDVVKRKVVVKREAPLATIADILYEGKCKPVA